MNNETSREKLDALILIAQKAGHVRNAIDSCISKEWYEAHLLYSKAEQAVIAERRRLWKLSRWGSWMSKLDKQLATITGEL